MPILIAPFSTITYTKNLEYLLYILEKKGGLKHGLVSFTLTPVSVESHNEFRINSEYYDKVDIFLEDKRIATILIFIAYFKNGKIDNKYINFEINYIQHIDIEDVIYYIFPYPARITTIRVEVASPLKDKLDIWFSPVFPYFLDATMSKEIEKFREKLLKGGLADIHLANKWVYPGNGYILVTWQKNH